MGVEVEVRVQLVVMFGMWVGRWVGEKKYSIYLKLKLELSMAILKHAREEGRGHLA